MHLSASFLVEEIQQKAPTMSIFKLEFEKIKGENRLLKEEIRLLKEETQLLKEQRDLYKEKASGATSGATSGAAPVPIPNGTESSKGN